MLLLTFEVFDYSVHNFLVDSGASINVMPLSIANKIFHMISELKNVLIYLSSDHRVHQCIYILILDILEEYGVLLRIDWSNMLQGYFAMNWSHCGFCTRVETTRSRSTQSGT